MLSSALCNLSWRRHPPLPSSYPPPILPMQALKRRSGSELANEKARIAALERLVGRQALELEFLKGALRNGPLPRSGPTSVITGPAASLSPRDAG